MTLPFASMCTVPFLKRGATSFLQRRTLLKVGGGGGGAYNFLARVNSPERVSIYINGNSSSFNVEHSD